MQKELQKWMIDNFEDWYTICGMGKQNINRDEFMRLRNELKENGFDDIILVLMTTHYYAIEENVNRFILALEEIVENELKKREEDHPEREEKGLDC